MFPLKRKALRLSRKAFGLFLINAYGLRSKDFFCVWRRRDIIDRRYVLVLVKSEAGNNLEYSDSRTYYNVLVSVVEYDFSRNHHSRIPRQIYADWTVLIVKLAKIIYPAFEAPPLPDYLFFETETIPSDGPYSASADYYMLDYV